MHWGTVNLTNEDLRELPELLSETWKPENLANDPLAIPATADNRCSAWC